MSSGSDRLVLDAQPLIALMAGEPAAARISSELAKRPGRLLLSAVNWCEVLYIVRRARGARSAALAASRLLQLPLSVVDADAEIVGFAAALKAEWGLGLGDSFAAGLALALKVPLLTGDSDFLPLADRGLDLIWVGQGPGRSR